jgi:hypothetical protein
MLRSDKKMKENLGVLTHVEYAFQYLSAVNDCGCSIIFPQLHPAVG